MGADDGVTTEQRQVLDAEHEARELCVSDPNNHRLPEMLTLQNVFDRREDYKYEGLNSEEKTQPMILNQWPSSLAVGDYTVKDRSTFESNWAEFTRGVFNGMDWSHVFAAGGAVLATAGNYGGDTRGSDIDLFLYGFKSDEEANQKLRHVYETVKKNMGGEVDVIRTARAVTIIAKYPYRMVQIITRIYKAPGEVLLGFDIDSCCIGYDGENVLAMERFRRAITRGYNLVNPNRRSMTYESRLNKYAKRGFSVIVPGLDKDRVDPAIFGGSVPSGSQKRQSLARLLNFECEARGSRSAFQMQRLFRNRYLGKSVTKGIYPNEYVTHEDIETAAHLHSTSDYCDVLIPWGPNWYSQQVIQHLSHVDKAQFYSSGQQSHRHLFVTGIEGVINGVGNHHVWCMHCRNARQLESDDSNKYVMGPLAWEKECTVLQDLDHGRVRKLMTGSFQLDVSEWEKDVYLPPGQATPKDSNPLLQDVNTSKPVGTGGFAPQKLPGSFGAPAIKAPAKKFATAKKAVAVKKPPLFGAPKSSFGSGGGNQGGGLFGSGGGNQGGGSLFGSGGGNQGGGSLFGSGGNQGGGSLFGSGGGNQGGGSLFGSGGGNQGGGSLFGSGGASSHDVDQAAMSRLLAERQAFEKEQMETLKQQNQAMMNQLQELTETLKRLEVRGVVPQGSSSAVSGTAPTSKPHSAAAAALPVGTRVGQVFEGVRHCTETDKVVNAITALPQYSFQDTSFEELRYQLYQDSGLVKEPKKEATPQSQPAPAPKLSGPKQPVSAAPSGPPKFAPLQLTSTAMAPKLLQAGKPSLKPEDVAKARDALLGAQTAEGPDDAIEAVFLSVADGVDLTDKSTIFSDMNIATVGFSAKVKPKLLSVLTKCGAKYSYGVNTKTSHVIATTEEANKTSGSAMLKAHEARKPVLSLHFVTDCILNSHVTLPFSRWAFQTPLRPANLFVGKKAPSNDPKDPDQVAAEEFELAAKKNVGSSAFVGKVVCVTGFKSSLKATISKVVQGGGGQYSYNVNDKTNLVVCTASVWKSQPWDILKAKKFGCAIVKLDLLTKLLEGGMPPTEMYQFSESDIPKSSFDQMMEELNKSYENVDINADATATTSSESLSTPSFSSSLTFGGNSANLPPGPTPGPFPAANANISGPMAKAAPANIARPQVQQQQGAVTEANRKVTSHGFGKAYNWGDPKAPYFPDDYKILKSEILQVTRLQSNNNKYYCIEMHEGADENGGKYYRIFAHYGRTDDLERKENAGVKQCRYSTSLAAVEAEYAAIIRSKQVPSKGYRILKMNSTKVGSPKARELQKQQEAELGMNNAALPKKVSMLPPKLQELVEYIYEESLAALTTTIAANITARGIETPLGVCSKEQVEEGFRIVDRIRQELARPDRDQNLEGSLQTLEQLSGEFYTAIPHRLGRATIRTAIINNVATLSQKEELLQLMKDMLEVNASGNLLSGSDTDAKYWALRCNISNVPENSPEFREMEKFVHDDYSRSIEVINLFKLKKDNEIANFNNSIQPVRMLYHGSRICNWVGLLSRGILLPHSAVARLGVTKSAAQGWLGHGVYFGDSCMTSTKYTTEGSKGTMLMAICRVALGKHADYYEITNTLTAPPPGYNSTHGVRCTATRQSDFTEDEWVVYDTSQFHFEYLLEFKVTGNMNARVSQAVGWTEQGSLWVYTTRGVEGSNRIAGFDMDDTLITTKSGATFPKDAQDYQWMFDTVIPTLRSYAKRGFKIVIFTNQLGISTKGKGPEIKAKVEAIAQQIEVPIQVFIATARDLYRKPAPGMWNILEEEFNDGVKIDHKKSFYCGDAAGRLAEWDVGKKADFSASDRKFALNVGTEFETPEQTFLNQIPPSTFDLGVDPKQILRDAPEGNFEPTTKDDQQEVVILIGSPASGKSTFAEKWFVPAGYVSINNDTDSRAATTASAALDAGKSLVVDNTNASRGQRAVWIQMAQQRNLTVRCYHLLATPALCNHLNNLRGKLGGREVPNMAFHMFKKRYEPPVLEEGISQIDEVPFKPYFEDKFARDIFLEYT